MHCIRIRLDYSSGCSLCVGRLSLNKLKDSPAGTTVLLLVCSNALEMVEIIFCVIVHDTDRYGKHCRWVVF